MNKENMIKKYSTPQFEVVSNDGKVFFSASGGVVNATPGGKIINGSIQPHINKGN